MSNIGNRIKHYRTLRGYSQKELAEKIGVSNVVLSRYESSHRTPDNDTQIKIADILEISLDDLNGRKVKKQNEEPDALMFRDKAGFDELSPEEQQEIMDLVNDQLDFLIERKKKK
ncbi:helix-turn-helix transcriptional regulator [Salinicoccus sp. ID82-1]|uniref:helix-turn-helix domain-containing protein n=1 Tax=Salinicoccus sp. ID82-1 TaxID=2820269 RepID=UPI001F34F725|nr:helix-turn-helix transcriptional regulator [Salinicoccus sp. ID82-1]MCG1009262.1 helix-turn-helix transcriptional regulator [Salinicoccus sp. ID82-1]